MEMGTVELQIPSHSGFERKAMEAVAGLARQAGAGEEAARNLATAVAEACLNAMEHGHEFDALLPVKLTFRSRPGLLEVDIVDTGPPFALPAGTPSLRNKIEGVEQARGWGLYLIKNLVNKVELRRLPDGNLLRLTVEFPRRQA